MLKAALKFKYILVIGSIFFASCTPPAAPKCVVRVIDLDGSVVSGATVTLTAPVVPPPDPIVGTTGASGTVEFEFENPVIMNVEVTKDAMSGTGLAKMEEDEVTNVEVTITP